jgi:hypothetical protein
MMKLYQIELTHLKTTPHPNIDPGSWVRLSESLRDDPAVTWSVVERGYLSLEDAAERLRRLTHREEFYPTRRSIETGDYSGLISEYEPPEGLPHVVRDARLEIVHNVDPPRYLMATAAIHLMGDLSESDPYPCVVYAEDWDVYYGMWVLGAGFFDVRFPRATTRPPTPEEKAHWESRVISGVRLPYRIDFDGNRRVATDPRFLGEVSG